MPIIEIWITVNYIVFYILNQGESFLTKQQVIIENNSRNQLPILECL